MSDTSVIRRERTELFVGLFIIVGLGIMGALIWQFGKISDRIGERYEIDLQLDDASGIIEGSAVRFGGTKIGFVKSKMLLEDFSGVILTLNMDHDFQLPLGARFTVVQSGLMGDRYVNVSPPASPSSTDAKIPPGTMVPGQVEDPIKQIQEQVSELADRAKEVLAEMDSAIQETHVAVANFTEISEKFNLEVLSDDNLDNLADTLDKISLTSENLADASKGLKPLVDETQVTVKTAREPFEGATGALEELTPTLEGLQTAVASANQAINQVTSGSGLTAALVQNEQMRRDVESLLANLEAHGILGYKKGKKSNDAYANRDAEPPAQTAGSDESGGMVQKYREVHGETNPLKVMGDWLTSKGDHKSKQRLPRMGKKPHR